MITDNVHDLLCEKIINNTMKYIDTTQMRSYKFNVTNRSVFDSAIYTNKPFSLIYTPISVNRKDIIQRRIEALRSHGYDVSKTMILSMNVSTAKLLKKTITDIQSTTFSDFIDTLIETNYPTLKTTDLMSLTNRLNLIEPDETEKRFIETLSITDPKSRLSCLTVFINQNLAATLSVLNKVRRSEHSLNDIICQNKAYFLEKNPYDIESIIINGTNISVSALCSVIKYAYINRCNLMIIGNPEETIYDFNLSYEKTMNVLSAYTDRNIDIIHLNRATENTPIQNIAELKDFGKIDNSITKTDITTSYDTDLQKLLNKIIFDSRVYIDNIIARNEKLIILTQSKAEADMINATLHRLYTPGIILKITTDKHDEMLYGKTATKNIKAFTFQQTTIRNYFKILYDLMYKESTEQKSKFNKDLYQTNLDNMMQFVKDHISQDLNETRSVMDITRKLIDTEEQIRHDLETKNRDYIEQNIKDAKLVISTIHSAVDLSFENGLIILKSNNENIDVKLHKTALSRAYKTESIYFLNNGNFKTTYQKYIDTHR